METIEVGDDGIRLGQLLKLSGLVDTGGSAKDVLAGEFVTVNGVVETRRGAQLKRGDVIEFDGQGIQLT